MQTKRKIEASKERHMHQRHSTNFVNIRKIVGAGDIKKQMRENVMFAEVNPEIKKT